MAKMGGRKEPQTMVRVRQSPGKDSLEFAIKVFKRKVMNSGVLAEVNFRKRNVTRSERKLAKFRQARVRAHQKGKG